VGSDIYVYDIAHISCYCIGAFGRAICFMIPQLDALGRLLSVKKPFNRHKSKFVSSSSFAKQLCRQPCDEKV
jgi:hypothetical protein